MTTICSFCGSEIDEESEQNKDKKYLLCKCNHGFIPKGANSFIGKVKGGNINMVEKTKKEKVSGTLKCVECGKEVKRGRRGMERWAGKKYICRDCRKKLREQKKKDKTKK